MTRIRIIQSIVSYLWTMVTAMRCIEISTIHLIMYSSDGLRIRSLLFTFSYIVVKSQLRRDSISRVRQWLKLFLKRKLSDWKCVHVTKQIIRICARPITSCKYMRVWKSEFSLLATCTCAIFKFDNLCITTLSIIALISDNIVNSVSVIIHLYWVRPCLQFIFQE